jgi:hypothetical protein
MKSHNHFQYSRNEIYAYKLGYRVTKTGILKNPSNKKIGSYCKKGYLKFNLQYNKKILMIYAHRLQAYQKYGKEIYKDKILVRHLNSNKKDNSIGNIAIGTNKDNISDRKKEDRLNHALKASSFVKKYNNNEVRAYYNETKSYKLTMDKFNISSGGTLYYILKKSKR